MKFGNQVLEKIQNLLSEIDRPAGKFLRVKPQPPQQINNYDVYEKLYNDSKIKRIRQSDKENQKIKNEGSQPKFKISNKHTIFLVNQNDWKPIHQRIQDIQLKKQESLAKIRQKFPKKEVNYQGDQEMYLEMMERRKKQKKYTEQQLAQRIKEIQNQEKQRIERINRLKIKAIEDHSKDFRCKPYVGKSSKRLWQDHKLKKNLSSSVFQRFQQYQMERKVHMENTERQVRNRITPFAPRISENSRLIASNSKSRTRLPKNLSRSHSCKCLSRSKSKKKHHYSTALQSSRHNRIIKK